MTYLFILIFAACIVKWLWDVDTWGARIAALGMLALTVWFFEKAL